MSVAISLFAIPDGLSKNSLIKELEKIVHAYKKRFRMKKITEIDVEKFVSVSSQFSGFTFKVFAIEEGRINIYTFKGDKMVKETKTLIVEGVKIDLKGCCKFANDITDYINSLRSTNYFLPIDYSNLDKETKAKKDSDLETKKGLNEDSDEESKDKDIRMEATTFGGDPNYHIVTAPTSVKDLIVWFFDGASPRFIGRNKDGEIIPLTKKDIEVIEKDFSDFDYNDQ